MAAVRLDRHVRDLDQDQDPVVGPVHVADHLTAAVDLDGHVLVTAKDAQNPETTVRRRTAKGLSRKTANDPDLGNGRGPNPERGKGQDQETESGHGLEIDGVVLGLGPAADTGALAPGIEKGDTPGPAQGTRAREVKMISVTATIEIPKRKPKRIDSLQNPPRAPTVSLIVVQNLLVMHETPCPSHRSYSCRVLR